VYGFIK